MKTREEIEIAREVLDRVSKDVVRIYGAWSTQAAKIVSFVACLDWVLGNDSDVLRVTDELISAYREEVKS